MRKKAYCAPAVESKSWILSVEPHWGNKQLSGLIATDRLVSPCANMSMPSDTLLEYPFCLSSYVAAFDDGQLAQQELKDEACSWRSEGYADDSSVQIFDHNDGVGRIRLCNDDAIDQILVMRLFLLSTNNFTKLNTRQKLLKFDSFCCCQQCTNELQILFART